MGKQHEITAIEALKFGSKQPSIANLGGAIRQMANEKKFDIRAIRQLGAQGKFGSLFSNFFLRDGQAELNAVTNYFAKTITDTPPTEYQKYTGKMEQISRIDAAISGRVKTFGKSSATDMVGEWTAPPTINTTPIAIIGAGAGGLLIRYALAALGFHNVSMFDKTGKTAGIWTNKNVEGRTRNNPRNINFFNRYALAAAPGSGAEVGTFLRLVAGNFPAPEKFDVKVKCGSNFNHRISNAAIPFSGETSEKEFPIIINCSGLGKPRALNNADCMYTGATKTEAGHRWQQILDPTNKGQFVLIGLGNSTAEMLRQIHALQDQGHDFDYKVLTHYPKDSIYNPDETVQKDGKNFRIFRDISQPNLVDYQGDLPDSRYDYFRALHSGKIVSDVHRWNRSGPHAENPYVRYTAGRSHGVEKFTSNNHLYTLIGYRHDKEEFEKMGCAYDTRNECARYDYDGEFVNTRHKPIKGYFGLGAVLDAPHNRNAIVIPGMIFRLGDLLFSIVLRAAEYQLGKQ